MTKIKMDSPHIKGESHVSRFISCRFVPDYCHVCIVRNSAHPAPNAAARVFYTVETGISSYEARIYYSNP